MVTSGGKEGLWRCPSSPISPLETNTSRLKHRDKEVHPERRRVREKDPVCTGRTACAGLDFPPPKAYQHHRQLLSLPVDGESPSLPLHPLVISVSATIHKGPSTVSSRARARGLRGRRSFSCAIYQAATSGLHGLRHATPAAKALSVERATPFAENDPRQVARGNCLPKCCSSGACHPLPRPAHHAHRT